MNIAMALTERGLIPDPIVRYGMRRLILRRLKEEASKQKNNYEGNWAKKAIAIETDAANRQHYAIPAEFFRIILGPRLKYSSCFWSDDTEDLKTAEENALSQTMERAQIKDGMDILELGCGWGSLTLRMAEQFPHSKILAISNSQSQREYINSQCAQRGFLNVTVLTQDINTFLPHRLFDRIVSVEMLEHVRNHKALFSRIASWMKPGAFFFAHVFCHRSYAYPFETEGDDNWMGRYFFTGGMMPSEKTLLNEKGGLILAHFWRWDGTHYQKTARAWIKNLDSRRNEAHNILSGVYVRETTLWLTRWRLFLMACEEFFGYSAGQEWGVGHYLFQKPENE